MIVFFVRRYNDIDHMAPIVYRFAQDNVRNVLILCNDPTYDVSGDYRLSFLRSHGVRIESVYNIHNSSIIHRFVAKINGGRGVGPDRTGTLLALGYNKLLKAMLFNRKWAVRLLGGLDAEVLVFDWAKRHQNVTGALLDAAAELGIPTVGVPHGLKLWTLDSMRDDSFHIPSYKDFFQYDYVVVPNQLFKELFMLGGIPEDKLRVLGSARFCAEWERIYEGILPAPAYLPEARDTLKVVFMEGGYNYLQHENVMTETLERLARLDFVQLIVKPNTASSRCETLKQQLDGMITFDHQTPSLTLCRWADAVIMTCTSIAFEVYHQNKVMLYPKYFYSKCMVFEEMKAAWVVASYDELEGALRKLSVDRRYKPYSQDNVNLFLRDMVYGGVSHLDVLSCYKDFIQGITAQRRASHFRLTASNISRGGDSGNRKTEQNSLSSV